MAPKAVILMADYGNDPTEVAVPYFVFKDAGFDVSFATENGTPAACDKKMYSGVTQKLLGATGAAVAQHNKMLEEPAFQKPAAWTAQDFSLANFDLVFLPGGHDKGMQSYIQSASLHGLLAEYVPQTKRGDPARKCLAAICHGVQVLAAAKQGGTSSKSVIHDFETTALQGSMETGIFWATRAFLGDYYKTFGAGTDSVEKFIKDRLDDPEKQYKSNLSPAPFTHADPNYNYISARFPPDAELLAKKTVQMVNETLG